MSLITSLMYKLDWIFGVSTTFVYSFMQLFYIVMIFQAGDVVKIGGFSVWQVTLVFILGQIVWMFAFIFVFENVSAFRNKVMVGDLDHYLLKPVAPEFLLSFQKFGLVEASAMVVYSMVGLLFIFLSEKIIFTIEQWCGILLIGFGSVILTFCLYWMAGLVFFYWPNFYTAHWFLSNTSDVGRYPRKVYPGIMQWVLIYLMPLMCIINPIYDVMEGSLDFWRILDICLVILVFVFIYCFMWQDGLKRYSSAG
ncbi:MAG: ABC-2 family transporter protein [Patescibacteria group bacterium]